MFFFLLPVGVDYRTNRLPVVTFSLMGACVLMHLWSMVLFFSSESSFEWWVETFWFIPNAFSWLTIFTSMFVHADIFHLLGNMVYLFLFGASTEDRIGRWRFLCLYFIGGIAATFMHVAFTASHFASDVPLGGASGAISACMGGFMVLFPKMNIEFKYFGLVFFRPFGGEFEVRAWIVMSFWFLSDLFWGVLDRAIDSEGGGTAFGAHVGGYLLGMAGIGLLRLVRWLPPEGGEEEEQLPVPRAAPTARKVLHPTEASPYLIHQWDQQFGPYSLEEVLQYRADGSIAPEALFWKAGMEAWRPVAELQGSSVLS